MSFHGLPNNVTHYLDDIPVNLREIASSLGIVVKERILANLSGELIKVNQGYEIHLNIDHSAARKRFTLAHELSHFILHKDMIGDRITDDALYRSSLSDEMETEAIRSAADLIMPMNQIKKCAEEYIKRKVPLGEELVQVMAQRFFVSEGAMRVRLGLV